MTTRPDLDGIDATTFVVDALARFPANPGDATDEDLALLDALAQGVLRHARNVAVGHALLAAYLLAGEVDHDAARAELVALGARHDSCIEAARIVDDVTAALVAAGHLTVLNPGDAQPVVATTQRST